MAGPWERYGGGAEAPGPWSRYASQAPATTAPATFGSSVAQGLGDAPQGGAQFLVNALPRGVVDAVNSATAYVNDLPVVGPVTRALGMTPATREGINAQTVERERTYQASRAAAGDTGTDWGRMAGAAIPAVAGGLVAGAPRTLLGATASGATQGAVFGAAQPVTDPNVSFSDEKASQVMAGAGFGAAGGAVGNVVGRMISPNVSPQARALADAGVEMTPGQIAGGLIRRVEDRAGSIPLVGDAITAGQRRSVETFNRAAANRVLQPLNQTVPDNVPVGRDLAEFVQQQVRQAYDDVLPRVQPFGPDQQFLRDIAATRQLFVTPARQQEFGKWMTDNVISRFQGGPMDGATYQTIKSEIGRVATNYRGSTAAGERELGEAASAVQRAFQDLVARTNPTLAPALRRADAAYAASIRLTGAAGMQGAIDGVFTPAQLASSVRRSDPSLRHSAYARGDAMMQDLTDAGRNVLPSTVPNSGTADRLMLATLASAAASGAGVPLPVAGAGAAMLAAYSQPGSRLFQMAMMAPRPAPVRAAGNALTAMGGPVSVPLGSMLLSPPPPGLNQR